MTGSPPHTWRILSLSINCLVFMRITSTYVENTPINLIDRHHLQDHLHIRGEYIVSGRIFFCLIGSPPHTWRILGQTFDSFDFDGITSTYVENTKLQYEYDRQRWDHLHIRGEYSISVLCFFGNSGSPPHTWRILFRIDRNKHSIRITSTYVENTLIFLSNQSIFEDHLHIRGEYYNPWNMSNTTIGSPPHTWRILEQSY